MFGNILLVNDADIEYLAWLTLFVVVGALLMLRKLMFVTFDENYAKSQGMSVALIAYIMAIIIAITVVLSIKVMGIILLLSLMTIPAVIANSLTKDYRWMTLWAAITAVVGNVAGFVVSYMWDIPTGSCIIFTLMAMLICVKILSLYRNRLRL